MILISHRGNLDGDSNYENHPSTIDKAINLGFDVEVDVYLKNSKIYLGHDYPNYEIDFSWINNRKESLWIHCKDIESIEYLSNKDGLNYFFHNTDKCTLTSKGYIWVYPGCQPVKKSIAVMPEIYNDEIKGCIGVCSDYIIKYKK